MTVSRSATPRRSLVMPRDSWQAGVVATPDRWRVLRLEGVQLAFDAAAPRRRWWGRRIAPAVSSSPKVVLDEVDLEIPLEGVTAIAGPSGSGKSSLLRLCNRLDVPTRGRVTVDGTDLADFDPLMLRRGIGMVFQRPVVFAGTVLDNLRLAVPGLEPGDAIESLERCGLDTALLDREADQLSGGEAQRMCLARTLLTDPQVVLMDEPTSSLDDDSRQVVEKLVGRLVDDGLAVLWVTHDTGQAERLADRLLQVADGKVITQ
jgi:putative ABC transport system ATP-binding protein